MSETREFIPLRIAVLTVSDSRDESNDKSGALLVKFVAEAGHGLAEKAIVPDDKYRIREVLSRWIADDTVQVVLTTGGTGVTGRDGTPEAVEPLLDKIIDGFGETFRSLSYQTIGTSTLQSRAIAGGRQWHLRVLPAGIVWRLQGCVDAIDQRAARLPHATLQPGRIDAATSGNLTVVRCRREPGVVPESWNATTNRRLSQRPAKIRSERPSVPLNGSEAMTTGHVIPVCANAAIPRPRRPR